MAMSKVLRQYLETALWSSSWCQEGDARDGDSLDDHYAADDFTEAFKQESQADLDAFFEWISDEGIDVGDNDDERIAHDFWLTRNRHGAGFWDGDYPDGGRKLTKMAHIYGSVDLMPGDQLPYDESEG